MILNDQALEEAFCVIMRDLVFGVPAGNPSDILAVRSEQGKPRPNTDSYLDVRLVDYTQSGREEVGRPTDESSNLSPIDAHYRLEFRVRAVGKKAKNVIVEAQFAFNRPDVIDAFIAQGLYTVLTTDVTHVPILLETEWEPRSQFTVVFHLTQRQSIDLGYILSVDGIDMTLTGSTNGTYENESDEITT